MQEITQSLIQGGFLKVSDARNFERLLETAGLIARHVDYPGKELVVDRCREEVLDLTSNGSLSEAQAKMLQGLLLGNPAKTTR